MSSSKPQQPYRDDDHDADEVNAAFATPTRRSIDSTSTTSLILERIHPDGQHYDDPDALNEKHGAYPESDDEDLDIESGAPHMKPMENKVKRYVYIIAGVLVGGWLLALLVYLGREAYNPGKAAAVNNPITIEQIHTGMWRPRKKGIQWISGESDGLMLVPDGDEGYLEVQDVRNSSYKNILMKHRTINVGDVSVAVSRFWPSPDLKKVLVASHVESHWRHSFYARYFILDVKTQVAEPLVPNKQEEKIALAVWAPTSDAIAYVVDNNIRIREINNQNAPIEVTKDGSKDLFYGIPDWVYEEEVFAGATAMWWSENGKHLAFLRTNETEVPEYPLQYFASRPSGKMPKEGLENYPELDFIKYPKAGAPNPVVDLQFFDLAKKQVFSVDIKNDFPNDDRLITEVVWAGDTQVLIRETNRESDLLRMILIDVSNRSGKVAREVNVAELDGGWFEVSQSTRYIPADASKGRKDPGYIDTIIHDGYDHLAYFSPLDAKDPVLLTKGNWEVVDAPSGIDLNNGLVYFVSTERSSIERHVYSVKLDGTDLKPITNTTQDGFYDVSYSKGGGYALLTYDGPGIPWQKVIGMPAVDAAFIKKIEDNKDLKELSTRYSLPTFHYSTINIDGFDLNVVERRPPNFDENKKYPVIFHVYGGPGSQQVQKTFKIDFQAYMAGGLDYLVVTVDGRGTGFIGRKARVAVRGNLGHWE
ncbi:Similar to Probable dipeptidyl-aminopeptidase B; acc. no. D5GM60, partial [Pyronema omphalodes CBS 100304]